VNFERSTRPSGQDGEKWKNVETFAFDKRLNDAGRAKRGSRRFLLKFNRDESGGEAKTANCRDARKTRCLEKESVKRWNLRSRR
jgi:hypothetical protein